MAKTQNYIHGFKLLRVSTESFVFPFLLLNIGLLPFSMGVKLGRSPRRKTQIEGVGDQGAEENIWT
jgi:hypothetical protein